jgi:hypothetical protein
MIVQAKGSAAVTKVEDFINLTHTHKDNMIEMRNNRGKSSIGSSVVAAFVYTLPSGAGTGPGRFNLFILLPA